MATVKRVGDPMLRIHDVGAYLGVTLFSTDPYPPM